MTDPHRPSAPRPPHPSPAPRDPTIRFGTVPIDTPRARRLLHALTVGHLTVLAGIALLAVLLIIHGVTRTTPDDRDPDTAGTTAAVTTFALGVLALAAAQILSVRQARTSAQALGPTHAHIDQLAGQIRRSGWPITLAYYPLILGPLLAVTAPLPLDLLALLALLNGASLLLNHAYAAWIHRALTGPDPHPADGPRRPLPPGSGRRIRSRQRLAAGIHTALTVAAAALLAVTTTVPSTRPAAALPATLQITAALAATLLPIPLIRAVLLVRAAITGDTVHAPTLHRAARLLTRTGIAAVPAGLVIIAAFAAAPAADVLATELLAATRVVLLILTLGSATLQLASTSSIHLGDIPPRHIPSTQPREGQ